MANLRWSECSREVQALIGRETYRINEAQTQVFYKEKWLDIHYDFEMDAYIMPDYEQQTYIEIEKI